MKNVMKGFVCMVAVASLLLSLQSNAWAKKDKDWVPPGQAKKAAASQQPVEYQVENQHKHSHGEEATSGTPPGWSHGKKTGWHGSPYPPGWSKWNDKKRKQWSSDREHSLDDIHGIAIKYGIPATKSDEISRAFSQAIAGGLMINDAKDKLVSALNNPDSRKRLMINTTQSVLELLK